MTDEERNQEGAEESIEDLEAPAESQDDVAGGIGCPGKPSMVCAAPTCVKTDAFCRTKDISHDIVVYEQ
jgi:hypothetical protein